MRIPRGVVVACWLLLAVVVGSLVIGGLLGQPVGLAYVESDSMAPTLAAGDGFVAVPTALSGDPKPGDVVVFDAQELDGGGLTTHRVVAETEHGYVTRGDANVVTDQDGVEPHVTDGQVVATALAIDGTVLRVPHLGTAVIGLHGTIDRAQGWVAGSVGQTVDPSTLLVVVGTVAILLALFTGRTARAARQRTRDRTRTGVFDATRLVWGMALLICLVSLVTLVAMSGSVEFGIVSAESAGGAAHVIPIGESQNDTYQLYGAGALPTVTFLEPASGGIEVATEPVHLARAETENVSVVVHAPGETGYYLRSFAEYRYFAVLPTPVLATLHATHPWLAMSAVTGVLVGLFTLPFALAVGTGRIRTRERTSRPRRSLFTRGKK